MKIIHNLLVLKAIQEISTAPNKDSGL